ncbi:hypothetical protein [Gaetbulibacter jejuensis]|uniref:Uncharacterized protein n=1 Tax=Gaetbulibacter jejuensis TaxID=584607 RepID=A0ABN1JJH3_9FLAO
MVDIDLENIQMLTPKDIDTVELTNVKQIKSQNTYLKYGLIISGFIFVGFLAYNMHKKNNLRRNTGTLDENYFS